MPPLAKELVPALVRPERRSHLVLDYREAQPILERLRAVHLPLKSNLERLAALAASGPRPYPVLLLDYESNLRQWAPSVSFFSRSLAETDARRFRERLAAGIEAIRQERISEAQSALDECAAMDSHVGIVAYLQAKLAEADGAVEKAATLYEEARAGRFCSSGMYRQPNSRIRCVR